MFYIEVDGNMIIDNQSIGNSIKVISTDTTANTMTVDGGDWAGADGSGKSMGFFDMSLKNPAGDVLQYVPSLLYASGRTTAVVMEEAEQQQDTDLYRRCKGGAGGG